FRDCARTLRAPGPRALRPFDRRDSELGGRASSQGETHMKRSAKAVWKGSLKEGTGTFGVASGTITDQKFTFKTRFENEPGTNPEELIAAAHASCFSMAFSARLGER